MRVLAPVGAVPGAPLPRRVRLAPPRPARPVPRRSMGPIGRWIREWERRVNLMLGNHLWSRLPATRRPYSTLLDRWLTVAEADVTLAGLPAPLAGVTVLLVSDIHTGPFLTPAALQRTFDRLQGLEPDVILLAGDLITGRVEEFDPFAPVFGSLAAPLGVFAVLGNHDHYSGEPAALRSRLEDSGVAVLHNRALCLEREGGRLRLAGIDDLHWGEPDLDAALDGGVDGSVPTVLLSHNPDVFFTAARRGVPLVLAGHTHGGQVRIPGLPIIVKMSRFALDEGRYTWSDAELVVSRGLGATGVPLRFNCAPEAILLRLLPG